MAIEPNQPVRILVAEDDPSIIKVLHQILEHEGFGVIEAHDGQDAVEKIYSHTPDLVLLDVNMPKLNGFEVCQQIKDNVFFQNLPILMLTALGEGHAKVKGLETGADDYIVKPFDNDELLARVRAILRRQKSNLDANPLTHLPGNNSIEKLILNYLDQKRPFALLYVDLNHFKAYNDYYGFSRGDDIIRATARILRQTVETHQGFVGHVGGDDFVIFTANEVAETLSKQIIQDFDALAPTFYDEKDRKQGHIETTDRKGQKQKFPLISIAIGVILKNDGKPSTIGEISKISAEIKKCAKKNEGSAYFVDRRDYS